MYIHKQQNISNIITGTAITLACFSAFELFIQLSADASQNMQFRSYCHCPSLRTSSLKPPLPNTVPFTGEIVKYRLH